MAIEFDCPHCQHHYRLKDELAGKSATCKSCRQKIVIPQPITIPDDEPLSPEELAAREAAALAALSDEPEKVEQDAASQIIDVVCAHCGHKWTEPLTRAGKNALCPECKARIKIPEAKKEQILDWRQQQSKLPSLAKEKHEKLEGVQDAAEAQLVSGKALKDADATGEELEPRPLKQKVMFVLLGLAFVGCLVFGVLYLTRTRTSNKEDRLITEAQDEFTKSTDALVKDGLPKDELPLMKAVMFTAGGEHAVGHNEKDTFKSAMDQFAKGREALRVIPPPPAVPPPTRNLAIADLAVASLVLGGTEEQAREQIRIRWMPDPNLRARPNERVFTVHEELQKTLVLVSGADPEFRNHFARRLTRELIQRGQSTLALDLIPLALFSQPEQAEAKAIVALEIYRAEKGSGLPGQVARELEKRGAELKTNPLPTSAATLLLLLPGDKPQSIVSAPTAGALTDASRYAYTGLRVLEGKSDEALALAKREGRPEAQVRALVLCADWSPEPAPALDAALAILTATKGRKDVAISPYSIFRLAQIATTSGRHDMAKQFTELLPDDGMKAWAKGDAIRLRLAGTKDKAEDSLSEVPDDLKKFRAGYALGRLWLARQNARVSGNRNNEVKSVSAWPAVVVPFGKAGVALGLQDREK